MNHAFQCYPFTEVDFRGKSAGAVGCRWWERRCASHLDLSIPDHGLKPVRSGFARHYNHISRAETHIPVSSGDEDVSGIIVYED